MPSPHDHGAVATLYRGSFLDGFHMRGSPTFEKWVDQQRSRLEQRCLEAIRALARAAAARGDVRAAASWCRRALEVDPFDTDMVLRLVEASIASGDRAGALQHAQRHVDLLGTDLGLAPDPGVLGAIERLRAQA
jgi:DNA-binding SARP family transcriptional activator